MKRPENRVAVVTGASTSIGQASVIALAQEGAYVSAVDIAEAMSEIVDKIKNNGDKAKAYVVNITSEQQIDNFVSEIRGQIGYVDVLFSNAGVDNAGGRIREYPTGIHGKTMNVDMRGTFLMTKMVLPLMMTKDSPIVSTSPLSGQAADLYRSGCNAAKGAVINFTESIVVKYGRGDVRANVIASGATGAPLVDKLTDTSEDREGKAFKESQRWMAPLGRLGKPEGVNRLIILLASDESSFITGEMIRTDGGVMAYTWPGEMLSGDSWKRTLEQLFQNRYPVEDDLV